MCHHIRSAKTYQVESTIQQFTRFKNECVNNLAEHFINDMLIALKTELQWREATGYVDPPSRLEAERSRRRAKT